LSFVKDLNERFDCGDGHHHAHNPPYPRRRPSIPMCRCGGLGRTSRQRRDKQGHFETAVRTGDGLASSVGGKTDMSAAKLATAFGFRNRGLHRLVGLVVGPHGRAQQ